LKCSKYIIIIIEKNYKTYKNWKGTTGSHFDILLNENLYSRKEFRRCEWNNISSRQIIRIPEIIKNWVRWQLKARFINFPSKKVYRSVFSLFKSRQIKICL